MFDKMDSKNLDFWGITKHGQIPNPRGITKGKTVPEHIQSYYYAISKRMFSHPEFKHYWDKLPKLRSWKEAVALHETHFTKHFGQLGFAWDVYINTDNELSDYSDVSQILQMAFELVKDYKCPVIKRKSFTLDFESFFSYTLGDSTKKAFDYIRENTEYDTDLIWEDILRTASLNNIKDNLHLNYILPKRYVEDETIDVSSVKTALFAHLTYEDQIEFCMKYISSTLEIADIYVTTLSEKMKDLIIDRISTVNTKKLSIEVLPENNRGRDVGALWIAFKPHMENYDYICFIHNKKSTQDKPLTIGRGFAERCMENTIGSKEYVENVLGLFQKNPRLGMLFPPPVTHGTHRHNILLQWGRNYKNTAGLASMLEINVPIEKNKNPIFPAGGMFWFRPKALSKLIKKDWKYDDFHSEPMPNDGTISHAFERIYSYAAQSEGYYSAWIMTNDFASSEITSLNHIITNVRTAKWRRFKYNSAEKLRRFPGVYRFICVIYNIPKRLISK